MADFRLISRLDIKNEWVIKGIEFEGVKRIGKLQNVLESYGADWPIHEWLILDAVASLYGRRPTWTRLNGVADNVRVPMIVGGGIGSVEVADQLFANGADRIFINTASIAFPYLLAELSEKYGRQAICAMVEAKKNRENWEALYLGGREKSGKNVLDWVVELQNHGAGEIILVSVDQDGTLNGPDWELVKKVRDLVSVSLVYGGGVASANDLEKLDVGVGCDGVAFSSLLHFKPAIASEIYKKY